jgi:hypothetical protein
MPEQPSGPMHGALRDEILAPAIDYIESWLDGDADRMASCLHPALAKREIELDSDGQPVVTTMTRDDMTAATEVGYGRKYGRQYEAEVLEVFEDIAAVRVLSSVYMDLLHIGRFQGRWLIVNVLWQHRPTT